MGPGRMRGAAAVWARVRARLAGAGRALGQVIGAPDYERYLRASERRALVPLSRSEFERACLHARYHRAGGRCC